MAANINSSQKINLLSPTERETSWSSVAMFAHCHRAVHRRTKISFRIWLTTSAGSPVVRTIAELPRRRSRTE